jgi:hypothetical protein
VKGIDPLGTLPLFETPAAPKVFKPKVTSKVGTPKWSKYRPKCPVKCHHCTLYLHQNGGQGPASQDAKFRRQVGKDIELLCHQHAQLQREQDGLPKLKEGAA